MTTVNAFRRARGERVADGLLVLVMLVVICVTLFPFVYVVSMSISDPVAVLQQRVWLWPVGFSADAYKLVFETEGALRAYYNTLWYTGVGTLLNVIMTVLAAYPLSRRTFVGRKFFMVFIVVTMFFSGGLIPTYTLIQDLGLYNTRWAMIIPAAVNAFLIIVTRTFFQTTIPESLLEAAKTDGANDLQILWRIVLPLSKPILAVLSLFYAVGHWNDYFTPLIYLPNADLQPLSIFLSKILLQNDQTMLGAGGPVDTATQSALAIQMKYSLIVVVIAPIVCVYPFLQKHFVKGILVGGIKE
ncbi:carbohydrate ABC transporter permease [Actinopolymorpha pittospori]|uniref:Aldouronate transport system permease protein n=1 Tax=Actinopolymorpha pittospori TaxID=648752 RepID=A0A927R925_9ACTN|nr:carbohydrate ABC transporter permease [Actinopolymorpha pittospori]MBE1607367.1 putative aldouronate transport system permease protein [Actinopolymorpha pittospori]